MDINERIKTRPDLKSYFVKNAIPTESNFADFIDSVLNQREDGLVKSAGAPLSIEASGDASSQKRAINFYWDFTESKPHWVLSLNPRAKPADAGSAKPGFSISDPGGNSRLFIDRTTGNLGVSTVNPAARLDVAGGQWNVSTTEGDLRVGNDQFRFKLGVALGGAGKGDVRLRAQGGTNRMMLGSGAADVLTVHNNRVGIGTITPNDTLDVQGNAKINGFTETKGLAANDGTNSGVGRGVWLWRPSDSNHVIYSANGSSGKSPANRAAVKGFFDAGHRLRLRTATGQGFLFESNAERALVDIDSDNGNVWTRGAVYCGNSDIYFTNVNHNHTGIANKVVGHAAIENAKNYDALMILGRTTHPTRLTRKVRLWDYLQVNGTFVNSSDATEKKEIQDLEYGLAEVKKLRPVTYNWRKIFKPHKSLGLIGQEVREVIDEVVYEDDGKLSISYIELIAVLINAIKELDGKVESMQAVERPAT